MICGDESYTYAQIAARACGSSTGLASLGIGRGDVVALMSGNDPAFLIAWFGIAALGATLLPLDPRARPTESAGILKRAGASFLVGPATLDAAVEGAKHAGIDLIDLRELTARPAGELDDLAEPEDVAAFLPTSGTTGHSKLVMQTHRAFTLAGEAFPWWIGATKEDRFLTALPLFHLNALLYSTLGAMSLGVPLILLERFSARAFLDEAREYGATQFNAVGAMLEILARQPERVSDADNPLRLCYAAPAFDSEHRHRAFERRFGLEVIAGYALSETPFGTIWPRSGPRPYGSIGKPRQHPRLGELNTARIVDEKDSEVGTGEIGELLLRNPGVMKGYFNDSRETERALRNGWLHTGDLVRSDREGNLFFVARTKEIIRRRGENIAPSEIEEVLKAHPGVSEVAVVGVPSDLGEEDIAAYVMPSRELTRAALREWVEASLASYKVPAYFEIVSDLPRTPTGRVAKNRLPPPSMSRGET